MFCLTLTIGFLAVLITQSFKNIKFERSIFKTDFFRNQGMVSTTCHPSRTTKIIHSRLNAQQRLVDDLITWLGKKKVNLGMIEVRASPGKGYGVYAKKDIPSKTIVTEIPIEVCIYPEMVLKDPEIGEASQSYFKTLDDDDECRDVQAERTLCHLMAAFLVKELSRGKQSEFYPYIVALPWDSDRYILNWNFDELCLLQGSSILSNVYRLRADTNLALEMVREILPQAVIEHFGNDFDRICKAAFFLSNSRTAYYVWSDELKRKLKFSKHVEMTLMLAPLFDFLNHRRISPSCSFGEHESNTDYAMTVTTKRAVKAGEELTVSYGKKSNLNLFLVYDHVDDDPGCWVASVPMRLHSLDPLYEEKKKILTDYGYLEDGRPEWELTLKMRSTTIDMTEQQLAQMRIIAMNDEERLKADGDKILLAWMPEVYHEDFNASGKYSDEELEEYRDSFYDLSIWEQKDVLYATSRICEEALQGFPLEYQVNQSAINPQRAEIAKKLIDSEKAVLQSYIINEQTQVQVFESLGYSY